MPTPLEITMDRTQTAPRGSLAGHKVYCDPAGREWECWVELETSAAVRGRGFDQTLPARRQQRPAGDVGCDRLHEHPAACAGQDHRDQPGLQPGDYQRVTLDGGVAWYAMTPNGHLANLGNHTITEHDNGTITVAPSILIESAKHLSLWHGWLEHGIWRDV
jgi:hypothetical protein